MRIATITNWAYGATVCLTLVSGIIMLMASNADTVERHAVEQRQRFDELTEDIETDAWAQSDLARLYVIKKDPQTLRQYSQSENNLKNVELRLDKLRDNGASDEELALLRKVSRLSMSFRMNSRRPSPVQSGEKMLRPLPCFMVPPMSRHWNAHKTRLITFARSSTSG